MYYIDGRLLSFPDLKSFNGRRLSEYLSVENVDCPHFKDYTSYIIIGVFGTQSRVYKTLWLLGSPKTLTSSSTINNKSCRRLPIREKALHAWRRRLYWRQLPHTLYEIATAKLHSLSRELHSDQSTPPPADRHDADAAAARKNHFETNRRMSTRLIN